MKFWNRDIVTGWLLGLAATAVYLLTLEPTASFWDCGEFIAVSYLLQVGHPPGAPLYQLLAHAFSWLAGGDVMAVAKCCNALSAVAGGLTVTFMYWTIVRLFRLFDTPSSRTPRVKVKKGKKKATVAEAEKRPAAMPRLAAVVGSLCYLFCDTAWFSAVESEVYSLAMLLASATLWAAIRWYQCEDEDYAPRWLLLIALLLGMGVCVHLLTLLTAPVVLLLFLLKNHDLQNRLKDEKIGGLEGKGSHHNHPIPKSPNLQIFKSQLKLLPLLLFFFCLGLTPYLTIPIRSAAGTPINENHPSTYKDFKRYIGREQYEKAPLYPRMWRHHEHDAEYNASWCGGDTSFVGNARFYGTYQLTYMYIRYLMWNFSGRYNDRQGYGSPQNGQFITGFPHIDAMLVSTGQRPPESLHTEGRNVYFLLPLLLGLLGIGFLSDNRRAFWTAMTLFLMGGIILSLYLNHPCYEPRERDYAYILSFYAYCIFIAFGASWLAGLLSNLTQRLKMPDWPKNVLPLLLLGVPLLMAYQNWDDHDRSGRYVARDAAVNIINSCEQDERGSVLFTYGDNDTFPLWYAQTVERVRPDVRVENIGLMGWHNFLDLLDESMALGRPVYFSHYAYNQYGSRYPGKFQLEGNAYRLMSEPCDSVAVEPCYRHIMSSMGWHSIEGVHIDEVSCKFLEQYWRDVLLLSQNLADRGCRDSAAAVLDKTLREIPLSTLQDVTLAYHIAECYSNIGRMATSDSLFAILQSDLEAQLAYYHSMPASRQAVMPYTLAPKEETYVLILSRRGNTCVEN